MAVWTVSHSVLSSVVKLASHSVENLGGSSVDQWESERAVRKANRWAANLVS